MVKTQGRGGGNSAKRQKHSKVVAQDSSEAVLIADVRRLLATRSLRQTPEDEAQKKDENSAVSVYVPPERFSEVEVQISEISSAGDGLGLTATSDHVYVVPFSVPGDVVRAKIVKYFADERYTLTDFLSVVTPSLQRDASRVKCPYFAKCSGCQFQMLSYEDQLAHKKTIIERAYKNFSTLAPGLIPTIGDTIPSPLQYGYRTKLTPHFDGPPGPRRNNAGFKEVPPIGYMAKGKRQTLDIEDCPIGTDVLRLGMQLERVRLVTEIGNYKRGATILLRESTTQKPLPAPSTDSLTPSPPIISNLRTPISNGSITTTHALHTETKTCITSQTALSTESIPPHTFTNTAGAFFQNNNSILPSFTSYIRTHILTPSPPNTPAKPPQITNLIDAYCGSGLFTITLSSLFKSSTGIDISGPSIAAAESNASANAIQNTTFLAADASALFARITYPAAETVVIIDPPRKGCDAAFLNQLLTFGPRRVLYVSCNVHTQARDVGVLVVGKGSVRYDVESLVGFDFFPQTAHVEGVAILNRVEGVDGGKEEEEGEEGEAERQEIEKVNTLGGGRPAEGVMVETEVPIP